MDTAVVRRAVDEANRRLGEAASRHDAAAMAASYTEDARLLPPDAPIITGRAGIRDFWAAALPALGVKTAVLKTLELTVHNAEAATEVGEALLVLTGGPAKLKYVVGWRRGSDGAWQLALDIWNAVPA
jgi:ketosteroid isomerase-like protein